MKAYYVYDEKKEQDRIVIPDNDKIAQVDKKALELFISVRPVFDELKTSELNGLKPESFGRIVATRDDDGDVCIVDTDLWQQRMRHYL